jgi:AAA domain-containing protein/uncharacterized protein DUF4062
MQISSEAACMSNQSIYVVGGNVQAGNGLYIARKADGELLALCRDGTFAYVLTARQMGKSSLMVRTAARLEEEGIVSVIIDLSMLGVKITKEEWYLGLLTKITDALNLDLNVVAWWNENAHLGVTQRMTRFFEKALLARLSARLIVFIDEIDTTLGLDFADDFYAAIRSIHNARATNREFDRLSFVLMGVATPGELISDPRRTPFNIGQRVDLRDFTFKEALPLADGLGLPEQQSVQVLEWVIKWTNGHPYLSQRLCRAIAAQDRDEWSEGEVNKLVEDIFLGQTSEQDHNLQFVRDMLTKRAPNSLDVLSTYRDIRLGQSVLDEKQSVVKTHLKLSGIVSRTGAVLGVRNKLYEDVFNIRWVETQMAEVPATTLEQKGSVEVNVYISGAVRDMPDHLKEVLDACLRQGTSPMMMERLPAADAEAVQSCLVMIDQSDIYLGIFAYRYGYVPLADNPRQISLTEIEYNRAVERDIPRLIFMMDKSHSVTIDDVEQGEGAIKLKEFKERVLEENTVVFFKSPLDLRAHILGDLSVILRNADELLKRTRQAKPFLIQPLLAKDEP